MKKTVSINNISIGKDFAPYVIAELSGNHNGDIHRAKKLIAVAKDAGAQAVKFQTYTADSLTIDTDDEDFILKSGTWKGQNLYRLYEQAHTPYEWFPELFSYAREIGITAFSSPFDRKAVDFLETLNVPAYKIASNEITDWPLVEAVTKTGKPVIVSTGTATKDIISKTLDFIVKCGGTEIVLLYCVSEYPTPAQNVHLNTMIDMSRNFDVQIGLSDHTLGTATSVAAVALGARVIEKHFTLDRSDGGPDSSFSLEPDELSELCAQVKWAWESLGDVKYGGDTNLESKSIFTRQLWTTSDIQSGETISWDNVKSIRAPLSRNGISPMRYSDIIGAKAKNAIAKYMPLHDKDIKIAEKD